MTKDEVVRMLVGNGFKLLSADAKPNYHLFVIERTELLGARVRYCLAVASHEFTEADVDWLTKLAEREAPNVILVGQYDKPHGLPALTTNQLSGRLGGPILSLLPLEPDYAARLISLSANVLPPGLQGNASDLFEEYVHAGLQFLLGSRIVRYGQDRSFESLADGLAIGDTVPLLLYDSKAYKGGYEVTAESIRQFARYIQDFHRRYGAQVGRIFSFLVISGTFHNGRDSMEGKSNDLRAATDGVGLCFICAETLAEMVRLAVKEPLLRKALDWKKLLTNVEPSVKSFEEELAARKRDKI